MIRRRIQNKIISYKKEVLDNIGELTTNDPILYVEEFQGTFSLDARSALFKRIAMHKCYEPELVNLCIKHLNPDRDVLDIGANIGFFSVMFAKNINERKVLSIEPTQRALRRLRNNLKLNEVEDKVMIFEGVVSDKKGSLEIKTIKGKEEYSSIGAMKHPSICDEEYVIEKVDSITVDELVSGKGIDPGFMKVDVEGAEHLVFKGANNILQNHRPIILSELSDYLLKENGSSSQEVIDMIRRHDYDIIDPIDPSKGIGKKEFGDIMCFPKELKAI